MFIINRIRARTETGRQLVEVDTLGGSRVGRARLSLGHGPIVDSAPRPRKRIILLKAAGSGCWPPTLELGVLVDR